MTYKKHLALMIALIITVSVNSKGMIPKGQEISERFSINLSYSNVNSKQIVPVYSDQSVTLHETIYDKNPQYGLEGMYRLNRYWAVGIYFGYSKGTFISNEMLSSGSNNYSFTTDRFGKSYFYGLKTELQLLPLLLKTESLRLKVYCPVQIGFVSQRVTTNATNITNWDKPAFEIGAGLGLSYNFTKNIGVFGEYKLGKFYNQRNSQWKAGIVISF